jgi:hypothetical protein
MAEVERSKERSSTSLASSCQLGKGGRKKMTWDRHASEWRGER